MFHPIEDFHKYIQPGKRVHLAGIGGVSMCALAEVLQGMGVTVQGSDMSDSATVQHLRSVGIPVAVGHSAENLKNCDAVIRTAALHDNNPEIAGAVARGIPGEAVTAGLASFTGAGRRFEHKGTFRGAEVYDDYAHHPDEVQALLNAVRPLPHQRLILAFQPHTYTRTAALFDDFVNVLRQADRVVLAEIYAARETNELGISSRDLAAQIPHSV